MTDARRWRCGTLVESCGECPECHRTYVRIYSDGTYADVEVVE